MTKEPTQQRHTITNRFFELVTKPLDVQFELAIGDVIMKGSTTQIITGWGIYDNQMWTEKIYEHKCNLGAGNYCTVLASMLIQDTYIQHSVIKAYKESVRDCWKKYQSNFYTREQLDTHLSQF